MSWQECLNRSGSCRCLVGSLILFNLSPGVLLSVRSPSGHRSPCQLSTTIHFFHWHFCIGSNVAASCLSAIFTVTCRYNIPYVLSWTSEIIRFCTKGIWRSFCALGVEVRKSQGHNFTPTSFIHFGLASSLSFPLQPLPSVLRSTFHLPLALILLQSYDSTTCFMLRHPRSILFGTFGLHSLTPPLGCHSLLPLQARLNDGFQYSSY